MPIVRTGEATCVGHPDKLCDLIADRVLDDILWEDKAARIAVEVLASGRTIAVAREIATKVRPRIRESVRAALVKPGPLQVIRANNEAVVIGPQERLDQIREDAEAYNRRLALEGDTTDYRSQLNPAGDGVMGRIKIDKINVDLPIYHTSSDAVLRMGAGHMTETSLPVGGAGSHAAITAHRGLAESVLFTNLDKVQVGDQFVIEVLGEAQVYEVFLTRIVAADETDWLLYDNDRDLVTLITCNPLGINTERMLVTGERVTPTPQEAVDEVGAGPKIPGFPWFMVVFAGGLVLIAVTARATFARLKRKEAADDAVRGTRFAALGDRRADPQPSGRSGASQAAGFADPGDALPAFEVLVPSREATDS